MTKWKPIETVPDDFKRSGGQRAWRLRDAQGNEFIGKRGYFNNSGWREQGTNKEIWPVYWMDISS